MGRTKAGRCGPVHARTLLPGDPAAVRQGQGLAVAVAAAMCMGATPALAIIELLQKEGTQVSYNDPDSPSSAKAGNTICR